MNSEEQKKIENNFQEFINFYQGNIAKECIVYTIKMARLVFNLVHHINYATLRIHPVLTSNYNFTRNRVHRDIKTLSLYY